MYNILINLNTTKLKDFQLKIDSSCMEDFLGMVDIQNLDDEHIRQYAFESIKRYVDNQENQEFIDAEIIVQRFSVS